MITVITGENSFENERALTRILNASTVTPERFDGAMLELRQLPDLLMSGTLFATARLIVIRNLSENKTLWADFSDWLGRVSDDIHVVLVDAKLDKRTKTYKELQKVATVHESKLWSERDIAKAEQWVIAEAKDLGINMDKKCAQQLVARAGVDQWFLYQALQKLMTVDVITPQVIEELIEPNPTENVFNLLDAALRGNAGVVQQMVRTLSIVEDPYRLFGLLSNQAIQLVALVVGDKPVAEIAKDISAHPFALSKLSSHADSLRKSGVQTVIAALAEADNGIKTSAADPWLLIERALLKIAHI